MTFVIKDNFKNMGYVLDDYIFDVEGYDYVLYRETIFSQGNLVKKEFEKLSFIL